LESVLRSRLEHLEGAHGVAVVRGIGGVGVVELVPSTERGYFDELGPRLAREFLARDVLLRPLGNVVYVMPPYCVGDAEVHRVFDVIDDVLAQLA
jgi:adenosylmethionine-8-amino-7-oxononanoate aminotransferase